MLWVIVPLGHGADGGAGGSHRVALLDSNGRGHTVDAVDSGLVHAVEKLARVSGEGFHVAPLAFGVNGVKGQRGFARAAHARDNDQLAYGNDPIQNWEIVPAPAANLDGVK